MHSVSDLYTQLLAGEHRTEIYLDIAGTQYTMANIVSLSVSSTLYQSFSIGNAAAREIDLKIIPLGTIPRQAQIKVFARLTDGTRASEWIPKGVFFISTREMERETRLLIIHGYDAMLKAEATWLDSSMDAANWPMGAAEAVADIAARMDIAVDPRTALSSTYGVAYPVDGDDALTMREVLRQIAVANGGNWVISDAGELLLVGLGSIPPETNYLVESSGGAITFGGVRILV